MTAENRMKEICKNLYDIVSNFVKEKVGKDVCFYKSIYLKTTDGDQIRFSPHENELKFILGNIYWEQNSFDDPLLLIKNGEVRFRYDRTNHFDTSLKQQIKECTDINMVKELTFQAIHQYEQPDSVTDYIIEYLTAIRDECRELVYDSKTERIENYNYQLYDLFRRHMYEKAIDKSNLWGDRCMYTVGYAVDEIAKALWQPVETKLKSTDLLSGEAIIEFDEYLVFVRLLEEELNKKITEYKKYQPGYILKSDKITSIINKVLNDLGIPTKLEQNAYYMELTDFNIIIKTDYSDHYVLHDETTKEDIEQVKKSYRKSLTNKNLAN